MSCHTFVHIDARDAVSIDSKACGAAAGVGAIDVGAQCSATWQPIACTLMVAGLALILIVACDSIQRVDSKAIRATALPATIGVGADRNAGSSECGKAHTVVCCSCTLIYVDAGD